TLKNGKPVTTAEQWWTLRRPEIVEDMEREVYGRLPRDLPTVTWSVQSSERELVGRAAVIAKQLVGHVDNASYPAIAVDIAMTVVLPADAKGPVPLLIRFGRSALPAPSQPPPENLDQRYAALRALLLKTGEGEYHWMAGNDLKYGGPQTAADLPVDAHELIALCAPRLTFISYGVPEQGDARWLDHRGSYMAAVAAGPVFKLLGAKDLGVSNDYRRETMPPVNVGLLDGRLAWRQQ